MIFKKHKQFIFLNTGVPPFLHLVQVGRGGDKFIICHCYWAWAGVAVHSCDCQSYSYVRGCGSLLFILGIVSIGVLPRWSWWCTILAQDPKWLFVPPTLPGCGFAGVHPAGYFRVAMHALESIFVSCRWCRQGRILNMSDCWACWYVKGGSGVPRVLPVVSPPLSVQSAISTLMLSPIPKPLWAVQSHSVFLDDWPAGAGRAINWFGSISLLLLVDPSCYATYKS